MPGDVRVISLTGHELGSMLETTMTTMEMPAVEIGKRRPSLCLQKLRQTVAETPRLNGLFIHRSLSNEKVHKEIRTLHKAQ